MELQDSNELDENKEIHNERDKKKKHPIRRGVLLFLTGCIAGGALCTALYNRFITGGDILTHAKLSSVMKILDSYYLRDYDKEKLTDMAAAAAVMSVDDPYTVYYTKNQFADLMDSSNGDFVGIGATVSVNDANEIVIVSTVSGSPAAAAGLLPNDVILKINGEAFSGEKLQEAVAKMRGTDENRETGVDINVTVKRGENMFDIVLKRERIHTDSVSYKLLDNNIGYIKIDGFNTKEGNEKDTYDEFLDAVGSLESEGAQKLIFDVRDNGGGDADVVSKILDYLLPEGIIMYTEDKYGNRKERKSDASELDMDMAVITNSRSASAAELFTGALKDYKKAVIVGEKTFGKGVVQTVIPLADGSGIKVTTSSYFTPGGTCVQGIGITPDYVVPLADEDKNTDVTKLDKSRDTQLQKAEELLNK